MVAKPWGGGIFRGMGIKFIHNYQDIISLGNLLEAWKEFLKGKRNKSDVQRFQFCLGDNLLSLHKELQNKTYEHGGYHAFNISDPKPRNIHKANVRNRVLHHAIYRKLYPFFDRIFISDSFSCRNLKGTHKALDRFKRFAFKVSKNNTKPCWILKCDIKKFFASVDQKILLDILRKHIKDKDIIWLLEKVIYSFNSGNAGIGLPLGNLTSQLLVNIYMNEFDEWMKHKMKVKYYIRYADDFVILSQDRDYLLELILKISDFLEEYLKLSLHPDKVFIKTFASGVDFLGWVHFPDYKVLRTVTKKRMFKNLSARQDLVEYGPTLQSYLGLLKHGNSFKLICKVLR